jgi:hypothetical protein
VNVVLPVLILQNSYTDSSDSPITEKSSMDLLRYTNHSLRNTLYAEGEASH